MDVDGDSWQDITFTHRGLDGVSYWRNAGNAERGTGNAEHATRSTQHTTRFERTPLPGVDSYAYAMAWAMWTRTATWTW